MKTTIYYSVVSVLLAVCLAANSIAQRSATSAAAGDLYLISAKAGGVNFLEGNVSIARNDGRSSVLLKRDSIEAGETVETGADGRAEILLNPGSFVRLASNSRFAMITTSLDDLRLKLFRGSAIFEVYATKDFDVLVETPTAAFRLIESGVYRIDLLSDGATLIEVHRGRARVENSSPTILKAKQSAKINMNSVSVGKFERGNADEFETWSQMRGKQAVKANARLRQKTLTNSLLATRGDWNFSGAYGVWAFHPNFGYCFVPFGSSWYSPYGYWYRRDYWTLPLPPPPPIIVNPNPGGPRNEEPRPPRGPTFQRFPQSTGPSRRQDEPTINSPRIPDVPATPPIIASPGSSQKKNRDD